MIIGFNDQFPIIATAMNSEDMEERYPIVHLILKHEDKKDKRFFYLEFSSLAGENDKEKIIKFESELMKLIADNSNIDLPYKMADGFAKFTNTEIIPGRKYFLMPIGE